MFVSIEFRSVDIGFLLFLFFFFFFFFWVCYSGDWRWLFLVVVARDKVKTWSQGGDFATGCMWQLQLPTLWQPLRFFFFFFFGVCVFIARVCYQVRAKLFLLLLLLLLLLLCVSIGLNFFNFTISNFCWANFFEIVYFVLDL